MNKNDDRILKLKKQLEDKRILLSREHYNPKTNCLFVWNKVTYNLHVEDLEIMAIMVHSLWQSANELNFEATKIAGYTLTEWLDDIYGLMRVQRAKKELKRLDEFEKTLNEKLSTDKKTEMELDSIESFLK